VLPVAKRARPNAAGQHWYGGQQLPARMVNRTGILNWAAAMTAFSCRMVAILLLRRCFLVFGRQRRQHILGGRFLAMPGGLLARFGRVRGAWIAFKCLTAAWV
jgi:hypothetical protein